MQDENLERLSINTYSQTETCILEYLLEFKNLINNITIDIQNKLECIHKQIKYSDYKIYTKIETDIFSTPTDSKQYL